MTMKMQTRTVLKKQCLFIKKPIQVIRATVTSENPILGLLIGLVFTVATYMNVNCLHSEIP